MLGIDEVELLARAEVSSIRHYLEYFHEFQKVAVDQTVEKAVDALASRLEDGVLVLTVGYSRLVARVLGLLAGKIRITVGVVIPEWDSEWDRVVFAEEDRMMEAELQTEEMLRGRVFRTMVTGLDELTADFGNSAIVIGAEAVTFDGTVLHPRGRLKIHRRLAQHYPQQGVGRRFVICESYKVINVPPDVRTSRMLASIPTSAYQALVTDEGMFEADTRSDMQGLQNKWRRFVDRRLENGKKRLLFGDH